ncbi:hypothetical protein Tco_0382487 [Tanacetum coccineum]
MLQKFMLLKGKEGNNQSYYGSFPRNFKEDFMELDDAKKFGGLRFGDGSSMVAEVSTEDANHKVSQSFPSAWSNRAMTIEPNQIFFDTLSIDDLYNNLRVFEQELTSTTKSSASAQNVAFVSHSKSNTNKVKSGHTGAYSTYTPTSSNNIPEREVPASFADEVIYSLFAKQSEDLDLLHEDLEQIDDMDIEEMDINWQIAMIGYRI